MNHNPDIPDTKNIEQLHTAGNQLERELMKLHRYHHGPSCETCQALNNWWTATGR